MLSQTWCRERQSRLLRLMEEQHLDLAVLANPKTIHYLTGALGDPTLPQAFAIDRSGRSLLVTNSRPEWAVAGEVELYTAYTIERVFSRTTMQEELVAAVAQRFGRAAGCVAVEFEYVPWALASAVASDAVNLTPHLSRLRRRKDPDEIEAIRNAIRITEAGYAAIKARLEPGMTEYEAYSIMNEAMVRAAETSVQANGDYACGTRVINAGGPPTNRKLQAGDLCIYDLFPSSEGYLCDLCRTFVVGRPSALQQETWHHIMDAHTIAQKVIRPGARGSDIYQAIRDHLESFRDFHGSFTHHAGHGLGMEGWEFPWLTPGSDQVIEEGEVIACEPGLYGEALQGGIRLEHNYLVGAEGVVALDGFPMEL